MKSLIAAALLLFLTTFNALAATARWSVTVEGWSCDGCVHKTETVLKRLPGVKAVSANLATGALTVTVEDTLFNEADARAAVERIGYRVR